MFFLPQGSTGSSILSGDGDDATERWITASDENGIRKTVGTAWAHFLRIAYCSFDPQGKTIDSEGRLVWNVEELCDERLVVTIMSAIASISFERIIFLISIFILFQLVILVLPCSDGLLVLQLPQHGGQETETVPACHQERSRSQWFKQNSHQLMDRRQQICFRTLANRNR